jgi:hypothetical protein
MAHRARNGRVSLWEAADLRTALDLALFPSPARPLPRPLLVTEIGAYVKNPGADLAHELPWSKNILAILHAMRVGYVGWAWASDEQLEHGMLHQGAPNKAGKVFLESLPLALQ